MYTVIHVRRLVWRHVVYQNNFRIHTIIIHVRRLVWRHVVYERWPIIILESILLYMYVHVRRLVWRHVVYQNNFRIHTIIIHVRRLVWRHVVYERWPIIILESILLYMYVHVRRLVWRHVVDERAT